MLIDDFAHQHFAPYIWVKAVNGEFGIHDLMRRIVKVWLKVNIIGLAAHPIVHLLEFYIPAFIGDGMEGKLDVSRVNGHQSEEDGANIVGLTFLPDGVQIVDDEFRLQIRCSQAVGACKNQEIFWLEGQNILVKALQGHRGGIAAAP